MVALFESIFLETQRRFSYLTMFFDPKHVFVFILHEFTLFLRFLHHSVLVRFSCTVYCKQYTCRAHVFLIQGAIQTKTSKARLPPSTVELTARRRCASTPSSMSWSRRVHESSNADIGGEGVLSLESADHTTPWICPVGVLAIMHCGLITCVHTTTTRHSTDCTRLRSDVTSSWM